MLAHRKLVCLIPLLLATACGDGFGDRNEAVDAEGYSEQMTMDADNDNSNPRVLDGSAQRRDNGSDADEDERPMALTDDGNAEADEDDDPITVDATPEELIVSTEGFAAEPMDDTRGFAPEPFDPRPTVQTAPPPVAD